MFNLGQLCDELGVLLRPMYERSYGRRLIHDIEGHKKAMEKMSEESVQRFRKNFASPPTLLDTKIQQIIGRYVSPLDKILIEVISTDLKDISDIIGEQIDARNSLVHYSLSVKDPPLEGDLRAKIRIACVRASVHLDDDKGLIAQAQRILKPFSVMLRRKRNPNLMKAGVLLVQAFQKHEYSKTESIRHTYSVLSSWAPNNKSPSLESFRMRIKKYLP